MLKLLIPLITLFLGNFKGFAKDQSVAITEQVVMHIRALAKVIAAVIAAVVLSCVGVSLLIASVATQLDKSESIQFTPSMSVYVGMILLAGIVLFYSLRQKTWLKAAKLEERSKTRKSQHSENSRSGALENALALLVLDFVEERQKRRKNPEPSAPVEK